MFSHSVFQALARNIQLKCLQARVLVQVKWLIFLVEHLIQVRCSDNEMGVEKVIKA